ncbi:hox domain containing protein [Stylonychia lemnae]|uniref:Hox domain containing protein n=1 Tax=Stylonychia lemnae TaxID=5949 RepID=A0A078AXE8_STYLE|nr:hox domain containing protein [Stylonychia lemnae]|eukprot:CDW85458.1 hox domain containing protein [Stylonychia lemnae]
MSDNHFIRNLNSFNSLSCQISPMPSAVIQWNKEPTSIIIQQQPLHQNTLRQTHRNSPNDNGNDQIYQVVNVSNFPSSISKYQTGDSLFCMDSRLRTSINKPTSYYIQNIPSNGPANSNRINHDGLLNNDGSPIQQQAVIQTRQHAQISIVNNGHIPVTQLQVQSQVRSRTQNETGIPQNILQAVRNLNQVNYDISALDSIPPTNSNTHCKPSPFEGDKVPQQRLDSEISGISYTSTPYQTIQLISHQEHQEQSHLQQIQNQQISQMQKAQKADDGLSKIERDHDIEQRQKLLRIEHERINDKRRRQKKTSQEKEILEVEYLKNPNWDYQKKCDLAIKLNFTFNQVSKWNWDRRKKEDNDAARKAKKEAKKQAAAQH